MIFSVVSPPAKARLKPESRMLQEGLNHRYLELTTTVDDTNDNNSYTKPSCVGVQLADGQKARSRLVRSIPLVRDANIFLLGDEPILF